jgi:mannosyl-oligosaccharide alpha-1,2-mannosidase
MNLFLSLPGASGNSTASGPQTENTFFAQVDPQRRQAKLIETIESYFYAYRLTGNKIYQERAWDAFERISEVTRAPYGYSAIQDVMTARGRSKMDEQESFWLAETLTYLYLIFDDTERISLDDWVFNTEAHPLRKAREVGWEP